MITVWLLNDGKLDFVCCLIIFKPVLSCRSAHAISYSVSIVKNGDNVAMLSPVENRRHCGVFLREIAKK